MEALMFVMLFAFTPIKGTKVVEISYKAKGPMHTTMEHCLAVEKAFKDSGNKENAVVLCFPLQRAAVPKKPSVDT